MNDKPERAVRRFKMVCDECSGENVVSDAYAEWDVDRQDWIVANTFDKGAFCSDCDGECRIVEEVIEGGGDRKTYLVSLRLQIGTYEKQAKHVVDAVDERSARRLALESESHGALEFCDDEYGCWDCGEMAYRVVQTLALSATDAAVMKRLM